MNQLNSGKENKPTVLFCFEFTVIVNTTKSNCFFFSTHGPMHKSKFNCTYKLPNSPMKSGVRKITKGPENKPNSTLPPSF